MGKGYLIFRCIVSRTAASEWKIARSLVDYPFLILQIQIDAGRMEKQKSQRTFGYKIHFYQRMMPALSGAPLVICKKYLAKFTGDTTAP